MHTPKMWKRGSSGNYYVQVGRTQVNLGKNRKAANEKYREIVARLEHFTATPFADLCDEFLEWCEKNRAPSTYGWYRDNLESFCRDNPSLRVADLKPHHVTKWVDKHEGGDNHKHNLIRTIQRVCNWAIKQGYIDRSPLAQMEKPTPVHRDTYTSPEDFGALLDRIKDQEFRDFLTAMWETGARPLEVRVVTAENFDRKGRRWVFSVKERGKLKSRIVYLNDVAFEITERLSKLYPEGPIFRNLRGNPWRKDAIVNRFQRLKVPFSAYSLRHVWATKALKNGVDAVTVQKCMGHADGRMLERIYSHVDEDGDHMRAAMEKARGSSAAVVSFPSSSQQTDQVPLA